MTAISETVIGEVGAFGNINTSTIGASVLDEANSTVSLTYDSSRTLSRIDINTPATSLSAGNAACSSGVCPQAPLRPGAPCRWTEPPPLMG